MLTPADAAAVADAFGLGHAASMDGPVARGVQGQVWRLAAPTGTWAVKEWFEGMVPDDLDVPYRLQAAAVDAGVPAPGPRRTDHGQATVTVRDVLVRVESWVEVGPPRRDLDPAQVGRVLARLHQVDLHAGSGADVDPWYREAVGEQAWDRLVTEVTAAGASFADGLRALVPDLLALESCFVAPRQVRICHCDLWPDNVLPSPTSGLAVIDWENAGPADPAQELVMVLFGFAGGDPQRAAALASAYREAGGPARATDLGDVTMTAASIGHILQMHLQDWLDLRRGAPGSAGPYVAARVARAEAGVREVLDEPLDLATVDRLLRAARPR